MKFISIENGSSFWYFVPKWKVKNSERNQENQHCLHENEINKFCQMHHFFTGLLKWESVNVVDLAQIRPRQSKEKRTQNTQPPACPPLLCLHHQVVSMMARPKVIFSLNNNNINNVIKAINSSSVQPLIIVKSYFATGSFLQNYCHKPPSVDSWKDQWKQKEG